MNNLLKILNDKKIEKKYLYNSNESMLSNDLNDLLDLFIDENDISMKILYKNNRIINEFTFYVYCCVYDNNYDVFINLTDNEYLYSNILRKHFSDHNKALEYYHCLENIIKDNDLSKISEKLIRCF